MPWLHICGFAAGAVIPTITYSSSDPSSAGHRLKPQHKQQFQVMNTKAEATVSIESFIDEMVGVVRTMRNLARQVWRGQLRFGSGLMTYMTSESLSTQPSSQLLCECLQQPFRGIE